MGLVAIAGGREDPQARRVRSEVRARGGEVVWIPAPEFPAAARITLRGDGLQVNGKAFPLPRAVYVRSLGYHPLSPHLDAELRARPRGLVAQCEEKRALVESLLLGLEARGVRLVNTLEANAQHRRKPWQLRLIEAVGLPVPPWLATNDPAAVRRFAKEHGAVVYKPLAGGATVQALTPDDLTRERLAALALAPVLFQKRCDGVSLRAFVVGRRIVAAAEIRSAELDYRRGEESVAATKLSRDERRIALEAARACRMPFSGVDLIRTVSGPVLLECNPSPMFAVFERKTGQDVAGPLAALLLA